MALPTITITEGTLTANPELRYTQNGSAVTSLRVACNSRRKNEQTGQWENSDTTFLSISAFHGLAENIAREFNKGSKITITGQLKQRDTEHNGQKRTFYDVNAQSVSKPIPRFNNTESDPAPQNGGNNTYGAQNNTQGGFNTNEPAPF